MINIIFRLYRHFKMMICFTPEWVCQIYLRQAANVERLLICQDRLHWKDYFLRKESGLQLELHLLGFCAEEALYLFLYHFFLLLFLIVIVTWVLVPILKEGNRVQLPAFFDIFLKVILFYRRWHCNDFVENSIKTCILDFLL